MRKLEHWDYSAHSASVLKIKQDRFFVRAGRLASMFQLVEHAVII